MSSKSKASREHLDRLLASGEGVEELSERLRPSMENLPPPFRGGTRITDQALERRWCRIAREDPSVRGELLDGWTHGKMPEFEGNIENFIGTVKVPVGIAGPLRINGLFAHGDYLVPLATTEAALVASYHRGAGLLTAAGGCAAALVNEAVNRSPAFAFRSIAEAGRFVHWALDQLETFREITAESSRFARLLDVGVTGEGNHVYLNFEFTTGDAAGQNMVTIATQRIFDFILENTPIAPQRSYVEGNLSGDKKASAQAFTTVRGKKVCAEAELSADLIAKHLGATPEGMCDYWRMSALGGVLSGTIGVQGHYANGLAALFIACGQDPACVAESATGVTRFELTDKGGLYAAVTLPNLVCGTIGGGTGLSAQRSCLEILGLFGEGKSAALAEVCAGLLLAGELSIIGALSAGHFTRAHEKRARGGSNHKNPKP